MKFKVGADWIFIICGIIVIVSAVLKMCNVTKIADVMSNVSIALVFLTLAFGRVKETDTN